MAFFSQKSLIFPPKMTLFLPNKRFFFITAAVININAPQLFEPQLLILDDDLSFSRAIFKDFM